jgi:hypothetical protein
VEVSEEEGSRGVIEAVHPRRAALTRRSGNERERQTLVANLELAVIVFAAAEPRPDLWKLDRFLVLAEDAELDALIVLNKADLAPRDQIDGRGRSLPPHRLPRARHQRTDRRRPRRASRGPQKQDFRLLRAVGRRQVLAPERAPARAWR